MRIHHVIRYGSLRGAQQRSNPNKLNDSIKKIVPIRIKCINQIDLLFPRSCFDLFFMFYGFTNRWMSLKPYQLICIVPACETVFIPFVLMLLYPFIKIACHARIKDIIILISQYIYYSFHKSWILNYITYLFSPRYLIYALKANLYLFCKMLPGNCNPLIQIGIILIKVLTLLSMKSDRWRFIDGLLIKQLWKDQLYRF